MHARRTVLMDLAVGTMVVCTITITGTVVYGQFLSPNRPTSGFVEPSAKVNNWDEISGSGHQLGSTEAKLTFVLFSDFECPACGTFARQTFPSLVAKYPNQIRLIYRHWPLEQHRFAYPAARASECANAQGRFEAFHKVIYEQQERLGLTTFREFATQAGVPDLEAFDTCNRLEDPEPTVQRDILAATNLAATGTPTIVANGWLIRAAITEQRLDSIVRATIASESRK